MEDSLEHVFDSQQLSCVLDTKDDFLAPLTHGTVSTLGSSLSGSMFQTFMQHQPFFNPAEVPGALPHAAVDLSGAHQVPQLPPQQLGSLPAIAALSPAVQMPPGRSTLKGDAATSATAAKQLTAEQRGELELAKQRADKAAAGRRQLRAAQLHAKRPKSDSHHHNNSYHEASEEEDESDAGFSKLSPEEQEQFIAKKVAEGTSEQEVRRLKRLLRNRVSAQQARERKKAYVTSLEDQVKAQQQRIDELEQKLAQAEQSNETLRNIIKSMRASSSPVTSVGQDDFAAVPQLPIAH